MAVVSEAAAPPRSPLLVASQPPVEGGHSKIETLACPEMYMNFIYWTQIFGSRFATRHPHFVQPTKKRRPPNFVGGKADMTAIVSHHQLHHQASTDYDDDDYSGPPTPEVSGHDSALLSRALCQLLWLTHRYPVSTTLEASPRHLSRPVNRMAPHKWA